MKKTRSRSSTPTRGPQGAKSSLLHLARFVRSGLDYSCGLTMWKARMQESRWQPSSDGLRTCHPRPNAATLIRADGGSDFRKKVKRVACPAVRELHAANIASHSRRKGTRNR